MGHPDSKNFNQAKVGMEVLLEVMMEQVSG